MVEPFEGVPEDGSWLILDIGMTSGPLPQQIPMIRRSGVLRMQLRYVPEVGFGICLFWTWKRECTA